MAGFFSPGLLERARILVLTDERVPNPEFYPLLKSLGFNNLPQIPAMEAVTFSDTIVVQGALADGVLFHELVHVEQYRQLGIPTFSDLYARGFLSSGGYAGIPLELNAYALQARFEAHRAEVFSVSEEVARWNATGKL